jgi:predicted lipid-binding transport protein (Tim44 family)
MPVFTDPQLVEQVASPQHYQPATARERRAQAVHRLQTGVIGLATMLLIVGLANIIMERARLTEASEQAVPASATASSTQGSDPLADIGLVPSPEPTASASRGSRR